MPQSRPCDVTPNGDQDKYNLALQDQSGRWYGLDVLINQVFPRTSNHSAPLQRVGFNSFHNGRGADKFVANQYQYFGSRNTWTSTPGKAHATQLIRFAKGINSSDENMPNANGVTWKRLTGNQRYLDISFVASASVTHTRLVLLIRRRVPAGTVGAPGTLTAELCSNSAGYPNTVLTTVTVDSTLMTDVVSEYYSWTISQAVVSGTTYHLKVYGASTDRDDACWEIACDTTVTGLRSSTNTSWSTNAVTTVFSPYYRLWVKGAYTLNPFVWDGALYTIANYDNKSTASTLWLNGVRGQAVGTQTTTTLQDTGNGTYGGVAWTSNRFAGCYVIILRGTGQGQVRLISSNDANTLTISTQWAVLPVAGSSEYVVYGGEWFVQISTTGLGVVTGNPTISNGIVYFPQGDSVNIRKMVLDYTDADDHAFASESTRNNKAYFLASGWDNTQGPQIWRANEAIAAGTPASYKISVARSPVSPLGVPLTFATDMTFLTSILTGDNTNLINGLHFHENNLYVMKADGLYIIQNDQAIQVKIGAERSPSVNNGLCAITAADKNMYMSYQNDVYLISGGAAYPTGLRNNMPSLRLGVVRDLDTAHGWLFAAFCPSTSNASGVSTVMKYSLDTKTWSQQMYGYAGGISIRAVQWQDCPESRSRLWAEMAGDLVYQEFPYGNGIRPYDDTGMKYQHEAVLILPTIDLNTVENKYFSVLTVTSQGLPSTADSETGHEIVVEFQADTDVGSSNWYHAGYIRSSPSGTCIIGEGNRRMIRIRLRMISSEALDPVIIETIGLTLFSRQRLANEWTMYIHSPGDDEEQSAIEVVKWLIDKAQDAEPLLMYSTFKLYHQRTVTLADEPRYVVQEQDIDAQDAEMTMSISLSEVV